MTATYERYKEALERIVAGVADPVAVAREAVRDHRPPPPPPTRMNVCMICGVSFETPRRKPKSRCDDCAKRFWADDLVLELLARSIAGEHPNDVAAEMGFSRYSGISRLDKLFPKWSIKRGAMYFDLLQRSRRYGQTLEWWAHHYRLYCNKVLPVTHPQIAQHEGVGASLDEITEKAKRYDPHGKRYEHRRSEGHR